LIDLPTRYSIEEVIKLFKGGSSYWINHSQTIKGKFAWCGGYEAFSVSHSHVARVAHYIANQEEHHRKRTYAEEYELFFKRYGLEMALREKPLKWLPVNMGAADLQAEGWGE